VSGDLIEQARGGDERALRLLYEGSRARVLRLAYSLLGDADEAEDVMQDVMVYALTHLDRYDALRAAWPTWLHTITVSRCRDAARRKRMRLRRVADWFRGHDAAGRIAPDDEAGRLDSVALAQRALLSLTPLQREAIVLREVEELSLAELAQVLGVPLRTAQARVASAHSAMRRALEGPPAWREGSP
jgi:RNA polymerase sigma-70 factor (ECF subfamily)